jgi:2-methylcitrate dehydratase PrpD
MRQRKAHGADVAATGGRAMNDQTPLNLDARTSARAETICETLAEFAVSLDGASIPADRRERARYHMLDAAGIALASTRYDFAHKTLAGLRAVAGEGDVGIFGMSAHLPPRDAATMNGFLCHGLDYDDTHIGGIVHPTASVFPAVVSAARMTGATVDEAVTAYIVGVETAVRLGMCAKGGFHQVGFHPTGMIGLFGCTLAVGRMFGLNAKQLRHAQGLALSMSAASLQFLEDGAWNKRFHPGWAASSAITAVALAREGFVGASATYEGRFGLFNSYLGAGAADADLGLATAGLGSVWELDRVAIKPFPTCHFTHAAIDSALALRDQIADVGDIERVEVLVPGETIKTICEPEAAKKRPQNDYDAKFSTHVLVATAFIKGRVSLAELEPSVFMAPDVLALADRVGYAADPKSAFPRAYSGEVRVTLKSGETLTHREHVNRGADDRPLSNDDILAKFRDNATMAVSPAVAERMIAQVSEAPDDADADWCFSVFTPEWGA